MPDPAPNPPPPEVHHAEEVLWTGRRSHWFYAGHWCLGVVAAAASGYAIYYFRDDLSRYLPWLYATPFVILLIVAIMVAFARSEWRYRVTNRRVIAEVGRVVRDSNEIRIQDIRSINVAKSGFTGLMGIGKLEFSSAATDDADVIFYQVGGADAVRDLVRKLQS